MDTDKVLRTISTTIAELNAGIQPAHLSTEEKLEILHELDALEVQALSCKAELDLEQIAASHPGMALREVLMRILSTFPDHLTSNQLSMLTGFVIRQWKGSSLQAAA